MIKHIALSILCTLLTFAGTSVSANAGTGLPPIMETTPCPTGGTVLHSWTVYTDNNQDGTYDWQYGLTCAGTYFTGKWPPDAAPVENVGTLHTPFFSHQFFTEQHLVSGAYRWRISMRNLEGDEVAWAETDWAGNFSFGENSELSIAPLEDGVLIVESHAELSRVMTEALAQGKSVKAKVRESNIDKPSLSASTPKPLTAFSPTTVPASEEDVLILGSYEELSRVMTEAFAQGKSVTARVVESEINRTTPPPGNEKEAVVE